jgi:hypothetical protein
LKQRTRLKKGLVSYLKSNGMIALRKHVDANHGQIGKKIKEEMNINLKSPLEIQPTKKRLVVSASVISFFFWAIDPYKKYNAHWIYFLRIWVINCPKSKFSH